MHDDVDPPLRARLQADLSAALKARDRSRTSVLRTLLAALANAEAVPVDQTATGSIAASSPGALSTEVARRELSPADEAGVLRREHRELVDAAAELVDAGRADAAEPLQAQAAIVAEYLVSEPGSPPASR
jgi:uncharacterized protein YqeY